MADWITTQEAAELSGYHPERLRELIREGKIVAAKKGNAWWVDRKSVSAYLRKAKKLGGKRGPKSHA
jgi:excisionase family DNA binding protein